MFVSYFQIFIGKNVDGGRTKANAAKILTLVNLAEWHANVHWTIYFYFSCSTDILNEKLRKKLSTHYN